jgi:hypothetical protein
VAAGPRPRYALVLACVAGAVLAGWAALTVSAWALLVVPVALVVGGCAWNGLTLAETWRGMDDGSAADVGRGPAGMGW